MTVASTSSALAQSRDPGIYFDPLGLIVQRDGDGGDTAQREGWAWFGIKLRELSGMPVWPVKPPISFAQTLDLLELRRTGEFRRHPTQGGWKSNPDDFSRDQLTPLVAGMGLWGDTARLLRSRAAQRPCQGVFSCVQGTKDIVGPDLVNLYNQALGETPHGDDDRWLAGGVAVRLAQARQNPEDVGDDLNLIVHLLMSRVRQPTPVSEQAVALYSKNRPVCAGCYLTHYRASYPGDYSAGEATMKARIEQGRSQQGWGPDCPRVLGALRWYFRPESGACSSLAELYAPLIDRWLS